MWRQRSEPTTALVRIPQAKGYASGLTEVLAVAVTSCVVEVVANGILAEIQAQNCEMAVCASEAKGEGIEAVGFARFTNFVAVDVVSVMVLDDRSATAS